jgi:hypothetical protein
VSHGARPHLYEEVAEDIASYVEQEARNLAEAMAGGGRVPFSAKLTRAEQEQYYVDEYSEHVYNKDGSPNEEGRAYLVKKFGADGFSAIARAVMRARNVLAPLPAGAPALGYPPYSDSAERDEPESNGGEYDSPSY